LNYLCQKTITSFAQSYIISSKNVTMFSVIEKTMISQSKKQFESCYEMFINCMIYSVLLFRTETFNSYRLCEKVFASDWESQLVYSQFIILRLMINWNKSIKTLNANLNFTAITCRTTESNKYLWWNSATISISSRSLQWSSFTSIKISLLNEFWSDTTVYETTCERLEARKADDIVIQIKERLSFNHQQIKKTKLFIEVQINKHRRNVIYEVNNWIWLSFRNVKTTRLCKDLKDKQLSLYQITAKVSIFYYFRLSVSMKHLHSMFSLKLLQSYSEDSLSEQHSESLRSIIIEDDEHWKIDDILNFRRYQDQIQYKVKWTDLDRNDEWYYVDKEKFNDSEKVLNEFHKLYSNKPR